MSAEHEEPTYELVMPFVVCVSNGGLYEDEAFVAGWRLAKLEASLEHPPPVHAVLETTVKHADVPQCDRIAMKHGYKLSVEPVEDDEEWVHAIFDKP
jgi:hypothetical protein